MTIPACGNHLASCADGRCRPACRTPSRSSRTSRRSRYSMEPTSAPPATMIISCSNDQAGPDTLVIIYARDRKLLGHRYKLGPAATVVTVGRRAENTITVDSDSISRCHARFEKRAEGWWVVDNDSTNGTFVNDERVPGALLRCGDRVSLGNTIFKFCCDQCGRPIDETGYSTSPIDGLTKAYNRRHLIEQLDTALRRMERPGHPLALVMFDL